MLLQKKLHKAFTLIEIIIVFAIVIFIVAGLAIPVTQFLEDSALDSHSQDIVYQMKKAKSYALMNLQASNWGIHFDYDENRYSFFRGDTYHQFPASYIHFPIPEKLKFQNILFNRGNPEVVFQKNTGNTLDFGSIQIYNIHKPNNPYTLSVNALGVFELTH